MQESLENVLEEFSTRERGIAEEILLSMITAEGTCTNVMIEELKEIFSMHPQAPRIFDTLLTSSMITEVSPNRYSLIHDSLASGKSLTELRNKKFDDIVRRDAVRGLRRAINVNIEVGTQTFKIYSGSESGLPRLVRLIRESSKIIKLLLKELF